MKSPFRSKTIWFNTLLMLAAAIEQNAHVLKPVMGEQAYAWLLFGAAIGNVLLRAVTTQPLAIKTDARAD